MFWEMLRAVRAHFGAAARLADEDRVRMIVDRTLLAHRLPARWSDALVAEMLGCPHGSDANFSRRLIDRISEMAAADPSVTFVPNLQPLPAAQVRLGAAI